MNPVVNALPGPTTDYQLLRDKLSKEQAFSEHLTAVLERAVTEKTALRRQIEALTEQLSLADEMAESVRAENNVLRDCLQKHGINPSIFLED